MKVEHGGGGTSKCIKHIRLECTTDKHNKFYCVCILREEDGTYTVGTAYAAIGKKARVSHPHEGKTYSEAIGKYNDIVRSKEKKGYKEVPWQFISRFADNAPSAGKDKPKTFKEKILDDSPVESDEEVSEFGDNLGKRKLRF